MSAAKKYIQPYLHKVYDWTQHNNLIINPDKTTCTLFTPDPAEYNSNLGLNINNKALPMALHPKVLGLTLDLLQLQCLILLQAKLWALLN